MSTTTRLYTSAQAKFADWCKANDMVEKPATHRDIARYLEECRTRLGPTTVPVQLSAIADLYRSNGHDLDTKNSIIQGVVAVARQQMKERAMPPETEKTYTILEFEKEHQAVVIFWPAELPIPAFEGEIGDRRITAPHPAKLYADGDRFLPVLSASQFQPDDDTPGLFLQCDNKHQREIIMRARMETAAMSRVWIAQCLCPQRHAILAAADVAEDRADAEVTLIKPLQGTITELLLDGTFNPWCGLCKASAATWQYEVHRTRFATMAEAEPVLRQSEAGQAVLREAASRATRP